MNLPKSMIENLQKSWAEQFYQNIFLSIQEDRFANLYSNICSRPNKAVNMLVSLLILKELYGLTDDELMGALYFDYRYQYAMGISDFENDTFSINTLTNFRQRLMVYEAKENIDLLKLETEALSNKLADLIALDRSMARMDSFMMSSSCKKLTRLELVFKVVQAMVKALHKLSPEMVPAAFQVYLQEQHQNEILYHTKNTEAGSKLETQFAQAAELYRYVNQRPDWHQLDEYKRLNRLLNDQCIESEEGDLIPIEAPRLLRITYKTQQILMPHIGIRVVRVMSVLSLILLRFAMKKNKLDSFLVMIWTVIHTVMLNLGNPLLKMIR
jgi:hypothetical protein